MNSKTIMIVLIAVLGSFVVLLIGVLVALLLFANGSFRFTTTSNKLAVSQTYDQVPTRIQIECLAAEVEVVPGNQVAVDIYGSTEKNNVQMNGDRLVITSTQGENGLFGLFTKGAKIRLTLPGDYSGELQVDCDMGDVEIGSFSGADIVVEGDTGDVEVGAANTLSAQLSAGDLEVDQVASARIISDLGDVSIDNVTDYVNLQLSCGDVDVENMTLTQNSTIMCDLGDVEIERTSGVCINATAGVGKVRVFGSDDSGTSLDISCDVGKIEVNQ